jgi:hypothetical protein
MKKILLALLFVLFGSIHFACRESGNDGCNDDNYPKSFVIRSMNTTTVTVNDLSVADSSRFYKAQDIAIRIGMKDVEYIAAHDPTPGFSFFNTASACSPVDPKATQYITKVTLVNQTDSLVVDSQIIPKGASLTPFFSMSANNPQSFMEISQFITLKQQLAYNGHYLLQFNPVMLKPTLMYFDITIEMNDGKVFLFEQEKLKLH